MRVIYLLNNCLVLSVFCYVIGNSEATQENDVRGNRATVNEMSDWNNGTLDNSTISENQILNETSEYKAATRPREENNVTLEHNTTGLNNPMPQCKYEVFHDGPTGDLVQYAFVGQQVYHKWSCDEGHSDAAQGVLCMTVHSCSAANGQGKQVQLLDEHGCAKDRFLLNNLEYPEDLVGGQSAMVFKFEDHPTVFFKCKMKISIKQGDTCQRSSDNCDTPPGDVVKDENSGDQSEYVQSAIYAFNVTSEYYDIKDEQTTTDMLTTQTIFPTPQCKYEVLRDGPTGNPVMFAVVGQQVYHKWSCGEGDSDAAQGVFCMSVHSCSAANGQGMQVQLLDEHGCAKNRSLLNNLEYPEDLVGGQSVVVFKLADDQNHIFFECQITISIKEGDTCHRSSDNCGTPRRGKRSVGDDIDVFSETIAIFDVDDPISAILGMQEVSELNKGS